MAALSHPGKAIRDWYWVATPGTWVLRAFVLAWSLLVLVPLLILLVYSFFETKNFFTIYEPTLNTWISLFDSGRWEVALRTLRIALTITLIELLIAFPFALWLAKGCQSKVTKAVVLALLTIPFFLDISSRTIVWRAILGQNGLINVALMEVGVISAPLEWMLYSEFSVHFGMLAPYFPTMVLPIYLAITLIDDGLLQASKDLGASPLQTLTRVIIPLVFTRHSGGRGLHPGPGLGGVGGAGHAGRRFRQPLESFHRKRIHGLALSDRRRPFHLHNHTAVDSPGDPGRRDQALPENLRISSGRCTNDHSGLQPGGGQPPHSVSAPGQQDRFLGPMASACKVVRLLRADFDLLPAFLAGAHVDQREAAFRIALSSLLGALSCLGVRTALE